MDYADLEIRILAKGEQGYPVEITFNREVEFPRGLLCGDVPDLKAGAATGEDGQALFDWLFADTALKVAWANARGRRPLRRIRLRIDESAPELHAVPWELLRDAPGAGAALDLAAADSTPFSRYMAGVWAQGSPILKRPIRVLVAVANPTDLEDYGLSAIDPVREVAVLREALAGAADVELVPLDGPATLPAIEAALRQKGGIHILHFIGHGRSVNGVAGLFLCGPDGKVRRAKDVDIAQMLGRQLADGGVLDEDKLRLVYLSSCESATRDRADAFRGLAPKLVAAGVPAVLAMQDLVPIDTATEFSRAFYAGLTEHGEVDRACNLARARVMAARQPGAAIPVLFMRLPAGQLLGNRGMIVGEKGESFWETLLGNIEDGFCTPFIGSGVIAGLAPSPDDMARQLASQFHYPFPDAGNLPRVAQFSCAQDNMRVRRAMLSHSVQHFCRRMNLPAEGRGPSETISGLAEKADWGVMSAKMFETEIHHQLAALRLPLYITTNTDNFMSLALRAGPRGDARQEVVRWRDGSRDGHELDPPVPDGSPVVLHLFGVDKDLTSTVLTEDDYLDYLAFVSREHERFLPYSVNAQLAQSTLLFLGYRLWELDLKIILRGLLTLIDRERYDMLNVAVQIESEDHDEARENEVKAFFQKYFSKAKIDIYWGSTAQFMSDLSARWQERRLGK